MNEFNHRLALCLAALVLLLPAALAEAQTRLGDTELGFSFDLDDLTEGSDARLGITLRAGRFVNENVEIGVELDLDGSVDKLTDNVAYRLFALYELNPTASSVWYARGGYVGVRFSGLSAQLLEAGVGFKSYIRDDTALYGEVVVGYVVSGFGSDEIVRTATGLVCTF